MMMAIEMVDGAGDIDWRGGPAGRTGTAAVDSSAPGIGGMASLKLLPFLHGRDSSFEVVADGKPREIMVTTRFIPLYSEE